MKLTKIPFLVLVLMVRTFRGEVVIGTSSADESTSNLVEGLVKILTSCYSGQINGVGLAGNVPDTLPRILSVQHLIPTTLMDDTSHMINATVELVPDKFRYKLPFFIVGASSYKQLNIIIQLIIKPSIWWNHMASFFILDQSQGCVNVIYFLFTAWQLDLLNAKVMCYHHKYGGYIFNYNPFTSQALLPWRQASVVEGINKHPFTLFHQKYQGNAAICTNIDFVKTNDLGGYQIVVEGKPESLKLRQKESPGLSRLLAERERILYIMYRALNVVPKFTGFQRTYFSPDVEMSMKFSAMSNATTYPYQQIGIVLVTKFRGHKTQLEKILYVIDINSLIGMGIVYLVTLIFLKFFIHQALGPALLNLVRITCNTGFISLPDNTTARMYLTGLLFCVVTMQGIYQGNLASLLTHKIPVRNINSVEDIVNFDYTIYGVNGFDTFLEPPVKDRFITTKDKLACMTHVLHDSFAACMMFAQGDVFDVARVEDLHLSKEFVRQVPIGFMIRPSWYLEQQMNTILGTIMEADIFESWEGKCNPTKLADFEFDKEVRNNVDFKVIEFIELRFAFVILGIGLLCATFTFIVEVAIYRYQQQKNSTKIIFFTRSDHESRERGEFRGADRTSKKTHAAVT